MRAANTDPMTLWPSARGFSKSEGMLPVAWEGDTLSGITQEWALGNGDRYREIADLNHLKDPNMIEVGQELILPGGAPALPTTHRDPGGPGFEPVSWPVQIQPPDNLEVML